MSLTSNTVQGRFTSDGTATQIKLPAGVDFMWVKNQTVSYASGAGTGAEFYWQRGMAQGRGTIYTKTASTNALAVAQIAANAGFYLIDTSVNIPGPSLSLTGITAAAVVNTANTSSLSDGDVVRIFSTVGAKQLGGLDFTIGDLNAGVSFDLMYMEAIASANPGAGTFRRIPYDPLYYPRRRYITKISPDVNGNGIITLSVIHGYTVGQVVRLIIPTVTASTYGMTELNGLQATIIEVGAADADGAINTITIDIDVSGFTAFAFPLTTAPGFTPAQVVPMGENTSEALSANVNILSDATENTGFFGIQLTAGANSPGGVDNDVIYWVAGTSFNVDNL